VIGNHPITNSLIHQLFEFSSCEFEQGTVANRRVVEIAAGLMPLNAFTSCVIFAGARYGRTPFATGRLRFASRRSF